MKPIRSIFLFILLFTWIENIAVGPGDVFSIHTTNVTENYVGMTARVSVASGGGQANAASEAPSVSADGRFVVFETSASNLAANNNSFKDVFVRDMQAGSTQLVSIAATGTAANGISEEPFISADGHFVAFTSSASNLVSGDANGRGDIFVRDLTNQTTELISIATGGIQTDRGSYSPLISADGRYVFFISQATNLAPGNSDGLGDLFVRDRISATTTRVFSATEETIYYFSISANGRFVVFSYTGNVYILDRQSGEKELVSVNNDGIAGNGYSNGASVSADGRFVVFHSASADLSTDGATIFLRDRDLKITKPLVFGNSPSLSADGRFVSFSSPDAQLVTGDINYRSDIFVYDLQNSTIQRVSIGQNGEQSGYSSDQGRISADGNYVVYRSNAELIPGNTYNQNDVFLSKRVNFSGDYSIAGQILDQAGQPVIGVAIVEAMGHSTISGVEGRFTLAGLPAAHYTLTFAKAGYRVNPQYPYYSVTDASIADLSFVALRGGTTERVSAASDGTAAWGEFPALSFDGRFVTFWSYADNLIAGDNNHMGDIWLRDRQTGLVENISITYNGSQADMSSYRPAISPDGRFVVFQSNATNFVEAGSNGYMQIFLRDRQLGHTEQISLSSGGTQANSNSFAPSVSGDGRLVVFESDADNLVAGDTNGKTDVFLRDRQTGTTERISVATDGTEGQDWSMFASISTDGRYVSFASVANNLIANDTFLYVDIFVRDLQNKTTELVSLNSAGVQSNALSHFPSISADGRYVAFYSAASNLVTGDTNGCFDVFVRDRWTSSTERVSVNSSGVQANARSGLYDPFHAENRDLVKSFISADGRYVAFSSIATNLVSGDTNGIEDIFMRDRTAGKTERVSVDSFGFQINFDENSNSGNLLQLPSISGDGNFVSFISSATNLTPYDPQHPGGLFVQDRFGVSGLSSISGAVSDTNGAPLENIVLAGFGQRAVSTAADGKYFIDWLSASTYTVTPVKPGYRFTPPAALVFVNGADSQEANFVGTFVGYTLSGAIETGWGVSKAGYTISDGTGRTIVTGEDGAFEFTGFLNGSYNITISKPGYYTVIYPITIANNDIYRNLNAGSFSGYTISGIVRGRANQPLSGVTVSIRNSAMTLSLANGSYSFQNLLPNSYTLSAALPGYHFSPEEITVEIVDNHATNVNFVVGPDLKVHIPLLRK